MDKNFLLTYTRDGSAGVKWFATEKEMADFVTEQGDGFQLIDSMEVNVIREDILPYDLDEV